MRIVLGMIALMLLFGCIGDEGERPPIVGEGEENVTEEPPISIIIGEQENQTIGQNYTEEPEEPPVVVPPEEEPEEPGTAEVDYYYEPEENLGVYFIDVSNGTRTHGDSILIKKGDFDMLIDAGPQEKGNVVVDFLRARIVDDIDVLVSTNADPKRYGGMDLVSDNFEIEHLWWSGDTFYDENYENLIESLKTKAEVTKEVGKGFAAEYNGIGFEVLHPSAERFEDSDNDAIVLRVKDREFSLLLTSGITAGAHTMLANEQPDKLKNQIIQAPHYGVGEGTSGIGQFLVKSEPEVMIVTGSADDSPENGGSREPFFNLLEQHGIGWRETYVEGTIRITTDGKEYAIQGLGEDLS